MNRQWQHTGNGFSLMIPLLSRGGIILKWRTMGFDCSRGWRKSNKTEPKSPRTDRGEEKEEEWTLSSLAYMAAHRRLYFLQIFIDTLLLCFFPQRCSLSTVWTTRSLSSWWPDLVAWPTRTRPSSRQSRTLWGSPWLWWDICSWMLRYWHL